MALAMGGTAVQTKTVPMPAAAVVLLAVAGLWPASTMALVIVRRCMLCLPLPHRAGCCCCCCCAHAAAAAVLTEPPL